MRLLLVAPAMLLGAAPPLAAQLKSLPVYPIAAARPGWAVALDYGAGLNAATGHARHVGGRVTGPLGPLRLSAEGGAWDAGASTSVQWGGTAGVRVAGGAPGSLALFALAGAGFAHAGPSDTAATYWTFPLGLAVMRQGRGVGGRALTPWLFPRAQVDRVSFAGVRAGQLGVGLSSGVSVDLTDRWGVHGALDWLHLFRRTGVGLTLEGGERVTAGIGAHLRLSGSR